MQTAETSCVPPWKGTGHTHLREDSVSDSARPGSASPFPALGAGAGGGKAEPRAERTRDKWHVLRAGRLGDSSEAVRR